MYYDSRTIMAEKHSSPDWFARGAAAVGILLSVIGLSLTYSNYRWQKEIYQENTAERILVYLDASRTANEMSGSKLLLPRQLPDLLNTASLSLNPKGEVGMEIVNIGLRPLFIKKAEMRIRDSIFVFYEHDPLRPSDNPAKVNDSMKLLEPSGAIKYKLIWDFAKHPLQAWGPWSPNSQEEDIEIQVETTKKTFSFQHQGLSRVGFDLALQVSKPRPKK